MNKLAACRPRVSRATPALASHAARPAAPPTRALRSTSVRHGPHVSSPRTHRLTCRAELPASSEDAPLTKAVPPQVKKGEFCRVNKAKFEGSVEAMASHSNGVYTGLGYIFEDRGEILDVKEFKAGPYALVAWVGISTAPAWLPMTMLEKVDKLVYQRV